MRKSQCCSDPTIKQPKLTRKHTQSIECMRDAKRVSLRLPRGGGITLEDKKNIVVYIYNDREKHRVPRAVGTVYRLARLRAQAMWRMFVVSDEAHQYK